MITLVENDREKSFQSTMIIIEVCVMNHSAKITPTKATLPIFAIDEGSLKSFKIALLLNYIVIVTLGGICLILCL